MNKYFDSCLYFRLNRVLRTLSQYADSAFAPHGMTSSYAYLLILVDMYPRVGTVELSQELNLSPSTVTRLVDKLVLSGYLARVKDGKRCEISCTESGSRMATELEVTWLEFQQNTSEQVSSELYASLNQELRKLERRID
ncbi:MAG: MarR family winged helix-turn-helix transcriptional regulator [Mangrovibacterium sp.]